MTGLLSKVLPKENSFQEKFIELAEVVHTGAGEFVELLGNFQDADVRAGKIKELEHRADDITHDLIKRLNQTFITPFDREDIHELSSKIDDVLDLIDAAASRMIIYSVDSVRPGVDELARNLQRATGEIVGAVRVLGKDDHILDRCIEINRLENEGDRISRRLTVQLFEEEKDPVQIIKWKEIIEVIETATDKCEDVANVIEAITLKNA